jgi:hypothetical protein
MGIRVYSAVRKLNLEGGITMVQKPRFRMYAAIALVLVLALTLPGCIKIVKETSEATAAPAATSTPASAGSPAPPPTAEPEYTLTVTIPGNAAVQQYMQLALCAQYEDAIALFRPPKASMAQTATPTAQLPARTIRSRRRIPLYEGRHRL